MCGRFVVASSPTLLADRFEVDEVVDDGTGPDYNIAPRTEVLAVRERARDEGVRRVLSRLRWGLVPAWAESLSIGDKMINARAETVTSKPAYRVAFEKRRCIIPADGFYEWRPLPAEADGGRPKGGRPKKEPMFVHRRDGEPMAFAGLWSVWKVPDELADAVDAPDRWVRTCAIVTTRANPALMPIHDRMPVLLPEDAWGAWLDPQPAGPGERAALRRLLVPAPDDWIEAYAVSTRVNQADDHDADLVRPVAGSRVP
jgi:putative SOS response-associated peptidase YedK